MQRFTASCGIVSVLLVPSALLGSHEAAMALGLLWGTIASVGLCALGVHVLRTPDVVWETYAAERRRAATRTRELLGLFSTRRT